MARGLKVLGAGHDPRRGIFISIEQVGLTTDPVSRVYLTPREVIRVTRSLLSALQQVEENRAVEDRKAS